jgi:hypothetical protein
LFMLHAWGTTQCDCEPRPVDGIRIRRAAALAALAGAVQAGVSTVLWSNMPLWAAWAGATCYALATHARRRGELSSRHRL